MMLTQISRAVYPLWIHPLFCIPSLFYTHWNGWKNLTMCTLYRAETFHTTGISYILHLYMPHDLVISLAPPLLLLLRCFTIDRATCFGDFPFHAMVILFFGMKLIIHIKNNVSAHTLQYAVAKSCTLVT